MKKWCIIVGILVISIGCNNKPFIQKGPAKILFFEKEFDFGTVNQEESMTHIFNFKNIGGDTLIIDKINAP